MYSIHTGGVKVRTVERKLSSRHLAATFGLPRTVLDIILEQRLRWLGHLGRMKETRLPKLVLFSELKKKRPFHGTKRRWRDVVKADVEAIGVGEGWYETCQNRNEWYQLCREGVDEVDGSRQMQLYVSPWRWVLSAYVVVSLEEKGT